VTRFKVQLHVPRVKEHGTQPANHKGVHVHYKFLSLSLVCCLKAGTKSRGALVYRSASMSTVASRAALPSQGKYPHARPSHGRSAARARAAQVHAGAHARRSNARETVAATVYAHPQKANIAPAPVHSGFVYFLAQPEAKASTRRTSSSSDDEFPDTFGSSISLLRSQLDGLDDYYTEMLLAATL
jgi:hypothetical protein